MDRPLSQSSKRNRHLRQIGIPLCVLLLLFFGARLVSGLMTPGFARDQLLLAPVERGSVEASLETSGVLLPAREITLAAPAETRVISVLQQPGSEVQPGQQLLALDDAELRLALESAERRHDARLNEKRRTQLTQAKALKTNAGALELAGLQLAYLNAAYRKQLALQEQGLVSAEAVELAKLERDKEAVNQRQLQEARDDLATDHQTEIEGLDLDIEILAGEMRRAQQNLARADAAAPSAGVVTWVAATEGATVRSGEPLARIADLTAFKVQATLSDFYAARVRQGMAVTVRIDDVDIDATLSRLLPEVVNGNLTFEIDITPPAEVRARPNLRVDVFLRLERRDDALRVRRGPGVAATGRHQLFVLNENRAVRREVELGMVGPEHIEIVSGLREGDMLILNDMRRYIDQPSLSLN